MLQELNRALGANCDPLPRWTGDIKLLNVAEQEHQRQKWWGLRVAQATTAKLLDTMCSRDQARLLEQTGGLGSSFMSAPPNSTLRFILSSDRYRLGLRWWLGLEVLDMSEGALRCAGCLAPLDAEGDHLLCCPRINFGQRHLAVQEALASLLQQTSQPFAREVQVPDSRTGS